MSCEQTDKLQVTKEELDASRVKLLQMAGDCLKTKPDGGLQMGKTFYSWGQIAHEVEQRTPVGMKIIEMGALSDRLLREKFRDLPFLGKIRILTGQMVSRIIGR